MLNYLMIHFIPQRHSDGSKPTVIIGLLPQKRLQHVTDIVKSLIRGSFTIIM
jgi:hypothetical protein